MASLAAVRYVRVPLPARSRVRPLAKSSIRSFLRALVRLGVGLSVRPSVHASESEQIIFRENRAVVMVIDTLALLQSLPSANTSLVNGVIEFENSYTDVYTGLAWMNRISRC